MTNILVLLLVLILSLALSVTRVSAEELIGPGICDSDNLDAPSEEIRTFCASLEVLEGRNLLKAQLRTSLSQSNQAPVARLEVFDRVGEGNPIRPTHIDLDASGSFDPDGFVERFAFLLFDAETNEVLAGPVFTRESRATLRVNRELPSSLRATVSVEDGSGGTDTMDITFAGPDTTCSTTLFSCTVNTGTTECQPTATNTKFTTADVLTAAQQCDASITKTTPVLISSWGASGGRGSNFTFSKGGPGGGSGLAGTSVTLAHLDTIYGNPDLNYCYGLGRQGWFHGTNSGSGGASTLLYPCDDLDDPILIAGGGGGGGAGTPLADGGDGGAGGVALSTTNSDCGYTDSCGAGANAVAGDGQGIGGATGMGGNIAGANNFGGQGGEAVKGGAGPAGWTQGNPMGIGTSGAGGSNAVAGGGAGGGGAGGGGSGGGTNTTQIGGGGGGSVAIASTQPFSVPISSPSYPGSLGFFFTPATSTDEQDSEE